MTADVKALQKEMAALQNDVNAFKSDISAFQQISNQHSTESDAEVKELQVGFWVVLGFSAVTVDYLYITPSLWTSKIGSKL